MKLLIATHNNKKKVELQRILSPLGIEVVTAEDIGCKLRDVEETGTTFEENALIILTVSRVFIRHAIQAYTATTRQTLTSFLKISKMFLKKRERRDLSVPHAVPSLKEKQ
mgnify:CR=1 FL=1